MKKIKLDGYEREIEKNISGYKKASSERVVKIERVIDRVNEKRSISLRVDQQDLEQIRLQAKKEGIPYQTFIRSILHKFISGQLVDQDTVFRSIQMFKRSSA